MVQDEYKVQLDVFEGPLDLLLYLIRKNEVEIHDIPVEAITTQYMEYLGMMRMLDLDIAGEFLVMAASLMLIKSRMLLPAEERQDLDEEEEDDPRWDLVRQLVEYKKFKDAAIFLADLEERRGNVFQREGEGVQLGGLQDVAIHDVSIFDLIGAFNQALSRAREESLPEIISDRYSVSEKVDQLMKLLSSQESVSLLGLFQKMTHRTEMICTFLALLELMRLKQVRAQQVGSFGDIVLTRNDEWKNSADVLLLSGED